MAAKRIRRKSSKTSKGKHLPPRKPNNSKLTFDYLKSKKVPAVLIAGLLTASLLGWNGVRYFSKPQNYYQIKFIFPDRTKVVSVIDGDTVQIKNGLSLRLVGIHAPNRGQPGYQEAIDLLKYLAEDKITRVEYDAYQDDKYGRILGYLWIECNTNLAVYCRKEHNNEMLANEIMVKEGKAKHVVYSKRRRLIYEDYLSN